MLTRIDDDGYIDSATRDGFGVFQYEYFRGRRVVYFTSFDQELYS